MPLAASLGSNATPAVRGASPLDAATIERVVNMTLHEKPPAATHWLARKLAKAGAPEIETAVVATATSRPHGGTRISNELAKQGMSISPPIAREKS